MFLTVDLTVKMALLTRDATQFQAVSNAEDD
jgi:hypothetical protein